MTLNAKGLASYSSYYFAHLRAKFMLIVKAVSFCIQFSLNFKLVDKKKSPGGDSNARYQDYF